MKTTLLTILGLITTPFLFGQWSQLGNDLTGNSADFSRYGRSVAMNAFGDKVIIGGQYDATGKGQIQILNWDGNQWNIEEDAAGAIDDNQAGWSVDMNAAGDRVIYSSPTEDDIPNNITDAGVIRIWEFDGSTWSTLGDEIFGTATGQELGQDVAMNHAGDIIAVSSVNTANGSVRVFEYNGSAWQQLGMDLEGLAASDAFGWSVALDSTGNSLIVGARLNDENGASTGHAAVYDWDGTQWTQRGSDFFGENGGDDFGSAVALDYSGGRIVIGARRADYNNQTDNGKVYSYEWDGSAWAPYGDTIIGPDGGRLGESLSLSHDGNVLNVGIPRANSNTGATYFLKYQGGANWTLFQNSPTGQSGTELFGRSVDANANGSVMVVGAFRASMTFSDEGYAKVYRNCINSEINLTSEAAGTITAITPDAEYQWLDCDNNYSVLTGETNQQYSPSSDGDYAVEVNLGGCIDTSNCVQITGVGLHSENKSSMEITVYPNPATDEINISSNQEIESALLFDLNGQLINKTTEKNIAVDELNPGFYLVQVTTPNGVVTKRIVKQ